MVYGPAAGLTQLSTLDIEGQLPDDHRPLSVRGHLLELAEDRDGAVAAYRAAAEKTASLPQQRYLYARAARLQP
jgi:predicted RNA polymerase sigma factor